MAEDQKKPVAVPAPAATVLLIRDGANGLEVFMVKRHHQIDFVAGALVFPGGKTAPGDSDAALDEMMDCHESWDATMRSLGAAAIREAFEESGILLAREEGSNELVSSERAAMLDHYRSKLDKKEISLAEMLRAEKLRLASDRLVHFAHWITPEHMPKRFDTHFFLAAAMDHHAGVHDGRETVDSVWIGPQQAIDDRKKWNVIFPTKLNLMKLAETPSVAEAMQRAGAERPKTVTPWIENGPEGQVLRIRDDAGYVQTSASMRDGL
jgi:8-oxo-dGTP pyrophosphatase MutT (NUDIX family)